MTTDDFGWDIPIWDIPIKPTFRFGYVTETRHEPNGLACGSVKHWYVSYGRYSLRIHRAFGFICRPIVWLIAKRRGAQ